MALRLTYAIREYMESVDRKVTAAEIKRAISDKYPGQWSPLTLQTYPYACAVNNPKAYTYYPYLEKFIYKNPDGTLVLYREEAHGPNIWAPIEGGDDGEEVEALVETTIHFESDLEEHLVNHLGSIEQGLELVERQHRFDAGRIDILAKDAQGRHVLIEIKAGRAKDSAIGQIARYMGWFSKSDDKAPRGIIIAGEFPEEVRYSLAAIPHLSLLEYKVSFSFVKVE